MARTRQSRRSESKAAPRSPISRRSFLVGGGTSAALILVSNHNGESSASAIELSSTEVPTAVDYITSMDPSDGSLMLTKLDATGASTVATSLMTVAYSPNRRHVAFLPGGLPEKAGNRATFHSLADAVTETRLTLPDDPAAVSFVKVVPLDSDKPKAIAVRDSVEVRSSTGKSLISQLDKSDDAQVVVVRRTAFLSEAAGVVRQVDLPTDDFDVPGGELVPMDADHVLLILYRMSPSLPKKVAGFPALKSPETMPGPYGYVLTHSSGAVAGPIPLAAGPCTGIVMSQADGAVVRLVGSDDVVEVISMQSATPVYSTLQLDLPVQGQRYTRYGFASYQEDFLTLFDYGEGRVTRFDLSTGRQRSSTRVSVTRDRPDSGRRAACGVDFARGLLFLADPGSSKSGVWVLDVRTLALVDRWLSMMPVSELRVLPAREQLLLVGPSSETAALVNGSGEVGGALQIRGVLV